MVIIMVEICQVRPTRHKFLNYYSPDVIFDIRADITNGVILTLALSYKSCLFGLTVPKLLDFNEKRLKWTSMVRGQIEIIWLLLINVLPNLFSALNKQ